MGGFLRQRSHTHRGGLPAIDRTDRAKYRLDDYGEQEIIKIVTGSVSCKTKNITVTVRGVVGP